MEIVLKMLRKVFGLFLKNKLSSIKVDYRGQKASNEIRNLLIGEKPFLVARLGAVEFECISAVINSKRGFRKYIDFIQKKVNSLYVTKSLISQAHVNAGIFPVEKVTIEKFVEKTLEDIEDIDVLGVWLKEQYLLSNKINHCKKIPLKDIEPYYHIEPWSDALAGKKVLVIHPFEESIKKQYSKNKYLFTDLKVLPSFELKTIKAVQTIAGESTKFKTWFDALEHMKNKMNEINYDVAIIGCGAYGLSLGAHAKRMGKQAIHMGGATQILFGIKGSRWDNHPEISKLYNEHWCRPLPSETPLKKDSVEDGCYW